MIYDIDMLKIHWGITPDRIRVLSPGRYKLDCGVKTFFFKRHSFLATTNGDRLECLYKVATDRDLMPEMIPSRSGALLVQGGRHLYSLQYFMVCDGSVSSKGLALGVAELHSAFSLTKLDPFPNHLDVAVPQLAEELDALGLIEILDIVTQVDLILAKTEPCIIHGDLHERNILWNRGKAYFLDIDSAHFSHPMFDLAFAAYRVLNFRNQLAWQFVEKYTQIVENKLPVHLVWHFLVWFVSQRVVFIHNETRQGRTNWINDLENQQKHLEEAVSRARTVWFS